MASRAAARSSYVPKKSVDTLSFMQRDYDQWAQDLQKRIDEGTVGVINTLIPFFGEWRTLTTKPQLAEVDQNYKIYRHADYADAARAFGQFVGAGNAREYKYNWAWFKVLKRPTMTVIFDVATDYIEVKTLQAKQQAQGTWSKTTFPPLEPLHTVLGTAQKFFTHPEQVKIMEAIMTLAAVVEIAAMVATAGAISNIIDQGWQAVAKEMYKRGLQMLQDKIVSPAVNRNLGLLLNKVGLGKPSGDFDAPPPSPPMPEGDAQRPDPSPPNRMRPPVFDPGPPAELEEVAQIAEDPAPAEEVAASGGFFDWLASWF